MYLPLVSARMGIIPAVGRSSAFAPQPYSTTARTMNRLRVHVQGATAAGPLDSCVDMVVSDVRSRSSNTAVTYLHDLCGVHL